MKHRATRHAAVHAVAKSRAWLEQQEPIPFEFLSLILDLRLVSIPDENLLDAYP